MSSYEFTDAQAFIHYLRVHCIARGYFFYITGSIPPGKDPRMTDERIIKRYEITASKWVRGRRRKRGAANVRYLRYGRFFILIATRGRHPLFRTEPGLRDARKHPVRCFGYEIRSERKRGTARNSRTGQPQRNYKGGQ